MIEGYERSASSYERGRPGYPQEAIRVLVHALRLGADTVLLDLAAGTGKLTRQLAPFVGSVIAVEPVAAMRHVLAQRLPEVEVLEGTAESIPLGDESVDAVTVAQAFQWFRPDDALAEIRRVLRPSGRLGIISNVRDLSTPEQAAVQSLISPYQGNKATFRSGRWKEAFSTSSGFTPLQVEVFPHQHRVDRSGLVDLVRSYSEMSLLPEGQWDAVVASADEAFDRLASVEGEMRLRYETQVYWTERIP